jgi:hypothetical protein
MVNAWADDDGYVIAVREEDEWRQHRLAYDDAVQLADMLRLLTHTAD